MEAWPGSWLLTVCSALLVWLLIKLFRSSKSRVQDLHHKAVLITGCDTGFGHELAKRLDALGVPVYAGVLFPEGDGASRLKQSCSSRLHILQMDVTRDDHVAEAVKTVKATLGANKLWAVVNNAGISTFGGFEWTPISAMKKVMEVNMYGPVRVTSLFLPFLKEAGGRVVIVASIAGHHSPPGQSAYNMSKHAMVAFGDTIRRELWNWPVSVHLIKPYLYRTNIANPENLNREINRNWETGNDFKSSYPSNYLDNFKKSIPIGLSAAISEEKIQEVIDAMEDAVIGSHPKVSYYPGIVAKVFHTVFSVLPATMADFFFALSQPPTKEGARNRILDYLYSRIKDEK